jgi:hypothetical protein
MCTLAPVDEGRKRVIGIMAAILTSDGEADICVRSMGGANYAEDYRITTSPAARMCVLYRTKVSNIEQSRFAASG